jgi:hypothetical protein
MALRDLVVIQVYVSKECYTYKEVVIFRSVNGFCYTESCKRDF